MGGVATHGMSKTPEFRAWSDMWQRCENPNNRRYADYGGRGIRVCESWRSFEAFFEDVGPRPSPSHSIDRKNNNGDYEPSNCRWASRSEQQHNRRAPRTENLRRGNDHWTRREPDRAAAVAKRNIRRAHGAGKANNNAKLTNALAAAMRQFYQDNPRMRMSDLGARFGVGRESARKVVKGVAWL